MTSVYTLHCLDVIAYGCGKRSSEGFLLLVGSLLCGSSYLFYCMHTANALEVVVGSDSNSSGYTDFFFRYL